MKKPILVLGLLAFALPLFGQAVVVPDSLENGVTARLFQNEVDLSFNANTDFGTYENNFLFAGLGNPRAGMYLYDNYTAFDTGFLPPLMLGYYAPKLLPLPFSAFAAVNLDVLENRPIPSDTSVPTYNTKVVVSGTTTTNMQWIASSTDTAFTDVVLTDFWTAEFQALTKVGPAVIGLQFFMNKDNQDSDAAAAPSYFRTSTTTVYYDTAVAGVAPAPLVNYTSVDTRTNINPAAFPVAGGTGVYDFTTDIRFGVPFALKTGNLKHLGYLGVTLDSTDSSGSYSNTESAHVYTVGGASVTEDVLAVVSKPSTTDIFLDYELRLPAGGSSANEWAAGASLGVGFNSNQYSFDRINRPYDLGVLNAKTALAGGTHVSYLSTYATTMDFSVTLSGERVFEFAIGSAANYRFAPMVSVGISTTSNGGNALETGRVSYTQVLDASGAYDGAAYDRTTIAVTGKSSSSMTLVATIGVPMGLEIKREKLPFGIMLGAIPYVYLQATRTTTAGTTSTQTVENITGTTVNSTTITPTISTATSTWTNDYSFLEEHYLGVSFAFDGGIRLDARLTGNLLDINNFVIQAVVPFK